VTCHGNVTRDRGMTVTCDSRVVSQGVSQCPDPTRPDPLNTYFPSIAYLGAGRQWMTLRSNGGGSR
jgi:hypothetical protein